MLINIRIFSLKHLTYLQTVKGRMIISRKVKVNLPLIMHADAFPQVVFTVVCKSPYI